jgi:hypothetical protein
MYSHKGLFPFFATTTGRFGFAIYAKKNLEIKCKLTLGILVAHHMSRYPRVNSAILLTG